MKIRQYPLCGEYHAEPAQDFDRPMQPDRIVVPAGLCADVVTLLGRPTEATFQESPPAAPTPARSWSNNFPAVPLTRRGIVTTMWRMMDLPRLLAALRSEAVTIATAQVPGRRKHPREVVLAALQTTTCPRLAGRSIEKWAQRLRREGMVGYDRRVGWYLVARPRWFCGEEKTGYAIVNCHVHR